MNITVAVLKLYYTTSCASLYSPPYLSFGLIPYCFTTAAEVVAGVGNSSKLGMGLEAINVDR